MEKENCRQLSIVQLYCTDSTAVPAYSTTEDMLSVKPHKTYIEGSSTVTKQLRIIDWMGYGRKGTTVDLGSSYLYLQIVWTIQSV